MRYELKEIIKNLLNAKVVTAKMLAMEDDPIRVQEREEELTRIEESIELLTGIK
jgi:hypothetical protein